MAKKAAALNVTASASLAVGLEYIEKAEVIEASNEALTLRVKKPR